MNRLYSALFFAVALGGAQLWGAQNGKVERIKVHGKALEGNGVIPDVEVKLTHEALLTGHDSVLDAALDWIRKQKESK